MASSRKSELVLTCNATALKDVMNFLNQKMDELIRKRDALLKKGVQTWTAQEKKDFNQWGKDIAALSTAQQKNREEMIKYGQVMKDLAGAKTKDLKRALGEVKRELDKMSARDPRRDQLVRDLRKIQAQIDANTGSIKKNASAWGALGTTLKNLVAYVGVFAMFNRLKSLLTDIYQQNKQMSDQLANIRKVSGLAMDDINHLNKNLAKIDTRSSINELNELAYVGAKLGFGELGTSGLESFVKSALKVQNALKEDMGADAMTALSKMVEVMGLIPKMGVERAMDATGSAIFKLASTSTATGTNIVEFSKRLMGLANIAHITTPELLAFGSAADAMALMPEVAATAFNKLITAMQKQPNLIEKALKIDKGTISDMYQAGHMADAMVLVFEKMREKGGMNALMHAGVFKDLGSDGARLVSVMATMANRVDILNKHMATSRQAFEESTAVAQEYAIQMETAEAYSERAANMWQKAFVNPEGIDVVKELTKAWYDVTKSFTQSERTMTTVKLILEGIVYIIKSMLLILPELLTTMGIASAWAWVTKLREGEGLLVSLVGWWQKLTAVQKAFWQAAGWVGLAFTIYEIGKSMYDLAQDTKEASKFMKDFKTDLSDLNIESGKAESELRRYRKAIDEANMGSKQRLAAINTFNSKFSPYLKNLLTEKSTAQDVADAYKEVTKAMRAKLALQLKEKDLQNEVMPREQWSVQRREEYNKLVSGTSNSQYNGAWLYGYLQDAKGSGKNWRQIATDLNNQVFHVAQSSFDSVIKQLGSGTFNEMLTRTVKQGSFKRTEQTLMGPQAKQLWAAMRYVIQDLATDTAKSRVDAKYKPEQEAIDAYLAAQQQEPIAPLEPAPDKGAQKELTKAQQEEKKRLRKEMEDAQKDSTAVINAIEEFYRLQETAVEQLVADGKTTREEADRLIEYVRNRKDMMLMNARRAIAGKDSDFEQLRTTMGRDLLRPDDANSQRAMNTVQTIDVQAAAARLQKFDGTKNVYDLNSGSFTQSMLKNAAQNELNIQRRQAAVQTEIDKLLLQYQFVEQAQKDFGGKLVKLGLITEGYDKVVQQLADGTEIVANTKDVQALATKTVGMDVQKMYGVDPDDALELRNMVNALMHTVDADGNKIRESFASMFPDLDKWLQDPEKYKEAMQAFYKALLDMDSDYYQALKQNHDRDKRLFEERWERSGKGVAFSDANKDLALMQRDRALTGQQRGTTFGELGGFNTLSTDPEIAASMLRMEQMRQELELLREVSNDKRLIREKEMEMDEAAMAMQEQIMSKINDRISKLHDWTDPINEFAIAIGDAAGTAIRDSQSMAEQVQDALKNMVKAYGDSTIKIISELMMQRVKKRMLGKAMAKETKDVQTEETNITEQGGKERLNAESIVQTGIASITQQMGQQILATKQQQDTQETQMEGQKARGGIMAGIAEGAAKIIGSLGWWGIPLIAVITALLNGLLNMALSALFGGNSSSSTSNSATSKVKLASGMLTYDEGNVGTYQGSDGQSYRATAVAAPADGLVTQPIATTVQGQPALVAERGPEIVIGRRTTRAIMMNEPGLIRYLANYNKNASAGPRYRAFDEGNLSNITTQLPDGAGPAAALTREDAAALTAAIGVFNQTVGQLQQKGIPCYINKFGTGGLIDEVKSGLKFDAKYNGK